MTRCFILFLAMICSESLEKQLIMEDKMEDLTEFQVWGGDGFALQVLQNLWMVVNARDTLDKLWVRSRSLTIVSCDTLTGAAVMTLTVLRGRLEVERLVQGLIGQEDLSWCRKLPLSQNLELTCLQVVPDLVSRSAGLRVPGHQYQFSCEVTDNISISLVP